MDEYEATFSGDGQYITERRWPFPEHTYEIVNAVPLGYTVWNIGHPVAGGVSPVMPAVQAPAVSGRPEYRR